MKNIFKKSLKFIKENFVVFVLAFIFIFCTSFLALWKYQNYYYDELDLAIFNQTFYNTLNNDFFYNTVQGSVYLGDHFEPYIFVLLPFYRLFQNPLILIILQVLITAFGVIPLVMLTRRVFGKKAFEIFFACVYFLNFSIWQALLFGFHMLIFALPLMMFWLYFYFQKNFSLYILFTILTLLVREDMFILGAGFALLALWDKRSLKWFLTPLLLSAFYGATALIIVAVFNVNHSYGFLTFYGWMGKSLSEIFVFILTNPQKIFSHFLRMSNFEFAIGFLMPFLGLPLARAKYLLPLSFLCLSYLFTSQGLSPIILQFHYIVLFLPCALVASVFALQEILSRYKNYQDIIMIVISIATLYSFLSLGPLYYFFKEDGNADRENIDIMAKMIRPDASLVTSDDFLPNFSSRKHIYPLHYIFMGHRQFSTAPYELSEEVDYALINFDSTKMYRFIYQVLPEFSNYRNIDVTLKNLLESKNLKPVMARNQVVLYEKDAQAPLILHEVIDENDFLKKDIVKSFSDKILLRYYTVKKENGNEGAHHLVFYWQAIQEIKQDYFLKVESSNQEFLYLPLAYHLYPTSKWQPWQIVRTDYYLTGINMDDLNVSLVYLNGYGYYNQLNITKFKITEEQSIGEFVLQSD